MVGVLLKVPFPILQELLLSTAATSQTLHTLPVDIPCIPWAAGGLGSWWKPSDQGSTTSSLYSTLTKLWVQNGCAMSLELEAEGREQIQQTHQAVNPPDHSTELNILLFWACKRAWDLTAKRNIKTATAETKASRLLNTPAVGLSFR